MFFSNSDDCTHRQLERIPCGMQNVTRLKLSNNYIKEIHFGELDELESITSQSLKKVVFNKYIVYKYFQQFSRIVFFLELCAKFGIRPKWGWNGGKKRVYPAWYTSNTTNEGITFKNSQGEFEKKSIVFAKLLKFSRIFQYLPHCFRILCLILTKFWSG